MKFNEQAHTYFTDEGEVYGGVTSLIKKFCKPFEREKIAKNFAKKHKRKIQDVLDEWDKAGKDSIVKGIAYHKIKEDELNSNLHILIEDEEHPVFKSEWSEGLKVSNNLKLEPGVYPELIVWSDKYKIAGQADYVEVTKKDYINIKDYKTSKEIKMHGYKRWDGTIESMKFPIHYLEDCNYNQYCLQINMYAFFVKQYNRKLKIGKMSIEHIIGDYNEHEDKFSNIEVISMKVPDMQKDVKMLLEYYKNQNS